MDWTVIDPKESVKNITIHQAHLKYTLSYTPLSFRLYKLCCGLKGY